MQLDAHRLNDTSDCNVHRTRVRKRLTRLQIPQHPELKRNWNKIDL